MTKNKRIPELDIVRGIAIFGVLILHSSFVGRFSQETMAIQTIMMKLFDWAVLAFFFSSGFLHDRFAPFAITIKKRFLSLMIPFFLYNFLYNLCFFTLGTLRVAHIENLGYKSLVLWPIWSPAFQLYFLPYLFVITLVLSVIEKLSQRYYKWAYLALLLLVAVFYFKRGYPETSHGSEYQKLPMYLTSFLIGVIAKSYFHKSYFQSWMIAVVFVMILSIPVFFQFCESSLLVPPLLLNIICIIRPLFQIKLLLYFGQSSGSIYLWHTPLVLPAVTVLLAYCNIPSILNLISSILLSLGACLLIRWSLDRFFLKITKKPAPKYITL